MSSAMKKSIVLAVVIAAVASCGLFDNQSTPEGYVKHCVRLLDRDGLYAGKPEWKAKRKNPKWRCWRTISHA